MRAVTINCDSVCPALHRWTARIFIDVIRLHCACGQNYSRLISSSMHGKRLSCTHAAADTKTVISSVRLRYQPIIIVIFPIKAFLILRLKICSFPASKLGDWKCTNY